MIPEERPAIWTPIGILRYVAVDRPRSLYGSQPMFGSSISWLLPTAGLQELNEACYDCAADWGFRLGWRHPIKFVDGKNVRKPGLQGHWVIHAKSKIRPNQIAYDPPGPITSGMPGRLCVRPFAYDISNPNGGGHHGVGLGLIGIERVKGPWGSLWDQFARQAARQL